MLVFGVIMLLAGGLGTWFTGKNAQLAFESKSWPKVSGRIVDAEVEKSSSGEEGQTTYQVSIRYEYSVKGERHTSNRIAFGTPHQFKGEGARDGARRYLRASSYSRGSRVTVYYQSKNPKQAVLEPGLNMSAFMLPVGLAVTGMLGLIFLVVGLKNYFTRSP